MVVRKTVEFAWMTVLLQFYLQLFIISAANGESESEVSSLCSAAQSSCGACVAAHRECSWCTDVYNHTFHEPIRCRSLLENRLNCTSIISPENEIINAKDEEFTVIDGSLPTDEDVIQLKPQAATLKLRIGEPLKMNVTFKKVIDYPLDLYYTMDLSLSMKDDLQRLQILGSNLVDGIRDNITRNVNLGFGTFVDKVILPYAINSEAAVQSLCSGECQPTFDFRHQLKITSNGTMFKNVVDGTIVSVNVDAPEGGLDALFQIAACTDTIGWRPQSLRVILFTTDGPSHCALDGKLAGIYEQHDTKCHLEEEEVDTGKFIYSKSLMQDYPSIGQLRQILEDNRVRAIFAVTSEVMHLYQDLPNVLGQHATIQQLANDSGNILSIISRAYNVIKRQFQMKSPEPLDNVDLSYRVLCPGATSWLENTLKCDNVEIDDEVVLQYEFTAKNCPLDPNHIDNIQIASNSISETFNLTIGYHCACNCTSTEVGSSPFCSNHGNLQCGVCECDIGTSGSRCQCLTSATTSQLEQNCTDPNGNAPDQLCNGNGICQCGECEKGCREGYYGEYCECRRTGCPTTDDDLECGGEAKGSCENCYEDRQCTCKAADGWYLSNSTRMCICNDLECKKTDNDTAVCSGNGQCNCKDCVCNDNSLYWAGKYCDVCVHPSCNPLEGSCSAGEFRRCAECVYINVATEDCSDVCQSLNINFGKVKSLPDCTSCPYAGEDCDECANLDEDTFPSTDCVSTRAQDQCDTKYKIGWHRHFNNYFIIVQNRNPELDCPEPINPLFIILPVAGGIFLFGLVALLVWKYFVTKHEKKKYKEFQEDVKRSEWSNYQNPLHKGAATRHENPMFDDDSAKK